MSETQDASGWLYQASLNAVGPVVTALLGGLVIALVVRGIQGLRENRELRRSLMLDMWRIAYGFYTALEEEVRRSDNDQPHRPIDLAERYEDFRVSSRILEAQLESILKKDEARWLWHCVIDLLCVRYYLFTQPEARVAGMINRHAKHPHEFWIPEAARAEFLDETELRDDEVVSDRFGRVLNKASQAVTRSSRPFLAPATEIARRGRKAVTTMSETPSS